MTDGPDAWEYLFDALDAIEALMTLGSDQDEEQP